MRRFTSCCCPPSWPPSAATEAKLAAWVAANGAKAYQAAVSGGQYQFPAGMFYGGKAPTWSNLVLRVVLREHAAKRERLGWIDFHTGLGPRGHGEKIYAGTDSAADIARTKSWWGADVTSFFDGYVHVGAPDRDQRRRGPRRMPSDRVRGDCARIRHVFRSIRCCRHFAPSIGCTITRKHPWRNGNEIKWHLRDMFYIDADDWKQMVCSQAQEACLRAVAQLGAAHEPA